jgi:uncharacterized membrane protein
MNQPESPHGRREVAVSEPATIDAAIEQMKPLLRPEKVPEARIILAQTISKSHSGPIPSAEEMELLERVLPGAADRCFGMAEREQNHRHDCDKQIIEKEFAFRSRGQWMALGAVVLLLAAVAYLAFLGDTKSAAALGAATLVGLVAAFTASKLIEGRSEQEPSEPVVPMPPQKKNKSTPRKR